MQNTDCNDYNQYTDVLSPDGKVIIDEVSGYPKLNPVNTIFGNTNPEHIFGVNTDLTYKDFNLRVVAEYRGGNYIFNQIGQSSVVQLQVHGGTLRSLEGVRIGL